MILMTTANGIEHGLVGRLVNQVPRKKRFVNVEPKKKEELELKIKADSEIVKVRYINWKNQVSGKLYKDWTAGSGEPLYLFNFLHGYTYQIPRGLVNQVNDPKRLPPNREGKLGENGPLAKDSGINRIHEFVGEI